MAHPNNHFPYKLYIKKQHSRPKPKSFYDTLLGEMEETIEQWLDEQSQYFVRLNYIDGHFEVSNSNTFVVDEKNITHENLFMVRFIHPDLPENKFTKYYTKNNIRRICRTIIVRVNKQLIM